MKLADEVLKGFKPKSSVSPYSYSWSKAGLTIKKDKKVIAVMDPFQTFQLKSFVSKFVKL